MTPTHSLYTTHIYTDICLYYTQIIYCENISTTVAINGYKTANNYVGCSEESRGSCKQTHQ